MNKNQLVLILIAIVVLVAGALLISQRKVTAPNSLPAAVQSTTNLDTELNNVDNTNFTDIEQGLSQNDSDASSF